MHWQKIDTRFWTDEKVVEWGDDTRLLALYILTCPHRITEGLFRLPKQYIIGDLKWSAERLAEPFAELLAEGFIEYDERVSVLLISKALEYNKPDNPNQAKAAAKAVADLPRTPLMQVFKGLAERFSKPLAERLGEGYGKPPAPAPAPTPLKDMSIDEAVSVDPLTSENGTVKTQPVETERESDEPQSDEPIENDKAIENDEAIEEVFAHYRETWQDEFPNGPTLTKTRKKQLRSRLKTFSPQQIKLAITTAHGNEFLRGINDSRKVYGTIDYFIRSDTKITEWIEAADASPTNRVEGIPNASAYGAKSNREDVQRWQDYVAGLDEQADDTDAGS